MPKNVEPVYRFIGVGLVLAYLLFAVVLIARTAPYFE